MAVPQNLIHARDRYLSKGIPLGGAIALPSVLYYESKLNPGSQGYQPTEKGGVLNPHGAYGIASWNGPRQKDLLDYATEHKLPVDNLDTQLDFVLTEIAGFHGAKGYPKSWAALRSSASYKSIVPIIVDEYEDPKDKQKEIDDAFAIAAQLAALPPPQPAPQAPVPEVPAPQAPPSVPSLPTAPAGLPPISSTCAGRIASGVDTLTAMREARVAELIADDPEIAAYDAALAAFGKLTPVIIHAHSPTIDASPAADTAVKPPQPTQRMKMDPQVSATLRSILLALGGAAVSKGMIDQNTLVSLVGGAVSAISYGWSLWGHSKTSIIAAAAALPEVQKIIAPPAIADSPKFAANPKVVAR